MDLPGLMLSYPGYHAFQLPSAPHLLHDIDNMMVRRADMFLL